MTNLIDGKLATRDPSMVKYDETLELLSTGLSKVTFYKLDGTTREMVCTRDPSIIPSDMAASGTSKRPKSSTVVPVYDVEEDGWRSFLLENLIALDKE